MKVLAIDTSNQTFSVALCDDHQLIGEVTNTVQRTHSVTLMPAIAQLFKESQVEPKEIERIVVAQGPGSYTGLRIGVTTAKTLAWTLEADLVGVSSLAVLAGNSLDYSGYLVPLFDARRQNVYTGVYQWQEGQLVNVIPDCHIALNDWLVQLQALSGPIRFVGRDKDHFQQEISAVFPQESNPTSPKIDEVSALTLAQLGLTYQPVTHVEAFVPTYLKLVEAEENWLKENQEQLRENYVEKI